MEADLISLDFDWRGKNITVVDIQDFFRDEKGPFKLVDIVREEFPEKSSFQCAEHSAISDARMTQKVAKRMLQYQSQGHVIYPKSIQRGPKPNFVSVGDRCRCGITKKRKPKGPSTNWRDYDM